MITKNPTRNPTKKPTKKLTKKTNNINKKESMWQKIWGWLLLICVCYMLFRGPRVIDYAEKRRYERAALENSLYTRFLDAIPV